MEFKALPKAFDPEVEAKLQKLLDDMKAREDAKHGPGAFDRTVRKGRLLMAKRADELTHEEAAFLASPPPAGMHSLAGPKSAIKEQTMDWTYISKGPDGHGTMWQADVAGGWLYLFIPTVGSPALTFVPNLK